MDHPPTSIGTLWQRLFRGIFRFFEQPGFPAFASLDDARNILDLTLTDRFHAKQGRSTARHVLHTPAGDVTVYFKRHYRLPRWHGILATLFPRLGWSPGLHEWQNLQWARAHGIPVPRPVAVGEFIGPWGRLRSFLAVEDLTGMLPLHEAIPNAHAQLPPAVFTRWKRALIGELVRLTRILHDRGHFHNDLYLCHFFVRADDTAAPPLNWQGRVHMIDFHRLQRRKLLRPVSLVKDLAQLLFSTDGVAGITTRDRASFWRAYVGTRRPGVFTRILRRLILFKCRVYLRHNRKMAQRAAQTQRASA